MRGQHDVTVLAFVPNFYHREKLATADQKYMKNALRVKYLLFAQFLFQMELTKNEESYNIYI